MIIIVRFGENNILCPKYIDIYEFGGVRGKRGIIQENGKGQEHDLY